MNRVVGPSAAVLALAAGGVAFAATPATAAASCTPTITISDSSSGGSSTPGVPGGSSSTGSSSGLGGVLGGVTGAGSSVSGKLGAALKTASSPGTLTFSDSHVTVTNGDCVSFKNLAAKPITVTVAGSSLTIGKNATKSTPGLTKAGDDTVKATEPLVGPVGPSGSGTITVKPASGSASPASGSSGSSGSGSGSAAGSSGGSGSTGGHQSSSSASSAGHHHHATATSKHSGSAAGSRAGSPDTLAVPSIPLLPFSSGTSTAPDKGVDPLVAPGQSSGSVTVPGTGSVPQAIGVPPSRPGSGRRAAATSSVEPANGGSRGLPVSIAAVLILGTGLGLARVRFRIPRAVDRGGLRVLRRA